VAMENEAVCLGKLAKRELPTFPQPRRRLGIPFSSSSFNFNFNEKCYPLARTSVTDMPVRTTKLTRLPSSSACSRGILST